MNELSHASPSTSGYEEIMRINSDQVSMKMIKHLDKIREPYGGNSIVPVFTVYDIAENTYICHFQSNTINGRAFQPTTWWAESSCAMITKFKIIIWGDSVKPVARFGPFSFIFTCAPVQKNKMHMFNADKIYFAIKNVTLCYSKYSNYCGEFKFNSNFKHFVVEMQQRIWGMNVSEIWGNVCWSGNNHKRR